MENKLAFDHIFNGRYFKHYVSPTYFLPNIESFEDALKEVIPEKLKLLLERASNLKTEKEYKLEIISREIKKGTIDEYFIVTYVMCEFAEYYAIQKWLNYWLSLWYKINPQLLPPKTTNSLGSSLDIGDIENAKQSPIQEYYEGILRRVGSRFTGLCCFHEEKTPSFFIFPDNRWHCFGACSTGGDVINFIMKLKKLTFPEAVRYLL